MNNYVESFWSGVIWAGEKFWSGTKYIPRKSIFQEKKEGVNNVSQKKDNSEWGQIRGRFILT